MNTPAASPSPRTSAGTSAPLAVLGGPKTVTRDGPHFHWPPITQDTTAAVLDQLQTSISVYDRSGVIADLETALAAYHGCAHAVLTSSGTAALHTMYAAAALRPGDEIIVPAYTFFAAAARITPRTKAIVVTHLWGIPADMTALSSLADDHGVHLFAVLMAARLFSPARRSSDRERLAMLPQLEKASPPGDGGPPGAGRAAAVDRAGRG